MKRILTLIAALVATGAVAQTERLGIQVMEPILPELVATVDTDVYCAGAVLCRMRAPAGGMTQEERTAAVYGRLAPILGDDVLPSDVQLKQCPASKAWFIAVKGQVLFTVTEADAEANGSDSAKALAARWLARARKLIPDGCAGDEPSLAAIKYGNVVLRD